MNLMTMSVLCCVDFRLVRCARFVAKNLITRMFGDDHCETCRFSDWLACYTHYTSVFPVQGLRRWPSQVFVRTINRTIGGVVLCGSCSHGNSVVQLLPLAGDRTARQLRPLWCYLNTTEPAYQVNFCWIGPKTYLLYFNHLSLTIKFTQLL